MGRRGRYRSDRGHHACAEAWPQHLSASVCFILWRDTDHLAWVPLRNGFVTTYRRGWLFVEPDFGNDRCDAADYVASVPDARLDGGRSVLYHRAVDRRYRVYRCFEWRHHFTGPQDRISGRRYAEKPADRHPGRRSSVGTCSRFASYFLEQHSNLLSESRPKLCRGKSCSVRRHALPREW